MNSEMPPEKLAAEEKSKTLLILGLTFILPVIVTLIGIYWILYTGA